MRPLRKPSTETREDLGPTIGELIQQAEDEIADLQAQAADHKANYRHTEHHRARVRLKALQIFVIVAEGLIS